MRLIRDILKDKRATSKAAEPDMDALPVDIGMEDDFDQNDFLDADEDTAPDPRSDQTLHDTTDEYSNDDDEYDDDDDSMFDDIKPLAPVKVAPRAVRKEVPMPDEKKDTPTEKPAAAQQPVEDFDGAAFMKRLNEPEASVPPAQPVSDPFDKLSAQQAPSPAAKPSPSPLKSMRSEFRDPPRAANPVPPIAPAPEVGSLDELTPLADAVDLSPVDIPAPSAGRGANRSGRVKTRLLGFSSGSITRDDPFARDAGNSDGMFPVGWVVVVSEMGRGASFPLYDGVARIGRGTDQSVSLNFGDNSISRENHISIAFDAEQNRFFVGHSGKSNLVRLNGKPLLSTEELHSKDLIRLGETTLRFIAFCEDDFGWNQPEGEMVKHA